MDEARTALGAPDRVITPWVNITPFPTAPEAAPEMETTRWVYPNFTLCFRQGHVVRLE
jgi:hypothetical protein